MTQGIIRRVGPSVLFVILALILISSTPSDSNAKRAGGHSRKSSHSASHHNGAKRLAKLSRHHRGSGTLTSTEKEEMAEKIRSLSTSAIVSDDTVVAAEAQSLDIQADLAQAAKEEQAEDDVDVSIERFFKARPDALDAESLDPNVVRERQLDYTLFDESDPATAAHRSDIMAQIIDWLGTRYQFGGQSRTGIDCSAFTREIFKKAFGVSLPRTAQMQSALGDRINKEDLQFGDLVFFHTANYSPVSHVGIYIGEGLFANAACSKGVSVASLSSTYWKNRYLGARRLFVNSEMAVRNLQKQIDALASQDAQLEQQEQLAGDTEEAQFSN